MSAGDFDLIFSALQGGEVRYLVVGRPEDLEDIRVLEEIGREGTRG